LVPLLWFLLKVLFPSFTQHVCDLLSEGKGHFPEGLSVAVFPVGALALSIAGLLCVCSFAMLLSSVPASVPFTRFFQTPFHRERGQCVVWIVCLLHLSFALSLKSFADCTKSDKSKSELRFAL